MEKTLEKEKIAVILLRSRVRTDIHIKTALDKLKLKRKNTCAILDKTLSNLGMATKVKDYVTFGEIDKETLELLRKKRENKNPDGKIEVYHLNSPKGGFERKGIKKPYSTGGALGYREDKINDLIKKML